MFMIHDMFPHTSFATHVQVSDPASVHKCCEDQFEMLADLSDKPVAKWDNLLPAI
jgi:hypothetical protein